MRTTAFPASIIAQMAARGDVKMRGATPQEKAIDAEQIYGGVGTEKYQNHQFGNSLRIVII